MGDLPPSALESLATCGSCAPSFWLGVWVGAAGLAIVLTLVAWWARGR